MNEQTTLAGLAWTQKKKQTRRERFLSEMDQVIPWKRLLAVIEPHYTKPGAGRRPKDLETMLRIYFLQQWFDLSDPAAEDALYDSESMRRFAGVELSDDAIPDESTILRFRRLLETHDLTRAIFEEIGSLLEEKGLLLKQGTIVDATIIHAPASTKNRAKARDPQMRSTCKGNNWYFGMKMHVGTTVDGLVHTLATTDAAQSDIKQMEGLLHGEEEVIYGDGAYWKQADRKAYQAKGVRYRVNRRGKRNQPLSQRWRQVNRARSTVRARGEHAFRVVKQLWGFTKVRYRGLAKNTVRAYAAFGLANLYMARRSLLLAGA
jgi:IS5 family transposase